MKRYLSLLIALMLLLSPAAQAAIAVNVFGNVSALVDENGETIVAPGTYKSIVKMQENLFAVTKGEGYALMDEKGEVKTGFDYTEFTGTEDGILFSDGEKYGIMDASFREIVPCEYTWLVSNGMGGFLALRTNVWDDVPDGLYLIDETGYVSPTGVKLAAFLSSFSDGLSPALSTANGRYGYLNGEGQWAIRPQYAYADEFKGGIAVASLDSGSGVIDTTGRWVITPKYDYVALSGENEERIVTVSYKNGITVFSSETFEEIYALDYAVYGAYAAFGANSVVVYTEDRVAQIGPDGQEILSVSPNGLILPVSDAMSVVYDLSGAYLIDSEGNTLLSGYRELTHFTEYEGVNYFRFIAQSEPAGSYRTGIIDQTGREILPCRFDHIASPEKGYLLAVDDERALLCRVTGETVWQYEF